MYEGSMYDVQRRVFGLLLIVFSMTLSAQDFSADRVMLDAYRQENMAVWKEHIDVRRDDVRCTKDLLYEYGYCGYIVAEAKKEGKEALLPDAKRYVQQFREHVEAAKETLPAGHYEMYMSAVYVFELRLHESFHPVKAMSLAKEAAKKAPHDPLTLSYLGTSLFYAPRPFGSKKEALQWFEKAQKYFSDSKWQDCWAREANEMYIRLCHDKYHL